MSIFDEPQIVVAPILAQVDRAVEQAGGGLDHGRKRLLVGQKPAASRHALSSPLMKSVRVFYSTAAALILAMMFAGFMPFFTSGHGQNGRIIAPAIFPIVVVHGLAITAWYVLSLVQALLIAVKNRRLHMKLGWCAAGIAPVVAISALMVAVRSVRADPDPNDLFFGMLYSNFLLVMLAEAAVFSLFVLAGILTRKRPAIHRAMMMLASLSLLLGATTRMPSLVALFGGHGSRIAFFGPVFALTAILLLVRLLITRAFDRWFAAGSAFMVIAYLVAEQLSRTDTWHHLASTLLKG